MSKIFKKKTEDGRQKTEERRNEIRSEVRKS
jgi:hypothetical protein